MPQSLRATIGRKTIDLFSTLRHWNLKNLTLQQECYLKGPGKRGHIVEDTLLPTHCCRHKCFPVCPHVQHLLRTQILCPGHKNVSEQNQKHFVSATNVSQFAQPKKHHGQQCVRNKVPSFARAFTSSSRFFPQYARLYKMLPPRQPRAFARLGSLAIITYMVKQTILDNYEWKVWFKEGAVTLFFTVSLPGENWIHIMAIPRKICNAPKWAILYLNVLIS